MPIPRYLLVLLLALPLMLTACDSSEPEDEDPPPATTGTISGRIFLGPGSAGSTSNTRVAIYQNFDDWNNDRFFRQIAADANGNYSFDNVNPGTYYFDAFKDNDNSGGLSSGDFFGVLGQNSLQEFRPTPQEVRAGENVGFDFQIFIIP